MYKTRLAAGVGRPQRRPWRFLGKIAASMRLRTRWNRGSLKPVMIAGFVGLCLLCPPFSYLMAPRYLGGPRRDPISRVEHDHEYFGAI